MVFFSIESDSLEFFRVFSFLFWLNSFLALLRAIDLSIELVLCFIVKKKCTKYKFTFLVQAIKSSAILLLFSNPPMISSCCRYFRNYPLRCYLFQEEFQVRNQSIRRIRVQNYVSKP